MERETLEFQISQYADGTLPAADVTALESVLATDPEAQALLAAYRSVDALLKREGPLPRMNWDRLSEHLSQAVAQEDAATRTIAWPLKRIAGAAVAALVLIAVGLAVWRNDPATPTQLAATPDPVVEVTGPAPELASGPVVEIISIDASPLARQNNFPVAETIVYRPSRVLIASGGVDRQDTPRQLPY